VASAAAWSAVAVCSCACSNHAGLQRLVAERDRVGRDGVDDLERSAVLGGVILRPGHDQLLVQHGHPLAHGRILGRRNLGHQRVHVRTTLDLRQARDHLHGPAEHGRVGMRELVDGCLQLSQLLVEAGHAPVQQLARLFTAMRGLARVHASRHPGIREFVDSFGDAAPGVSCMAERGSEQRRLDLGAPRRIPGSGELVGHVRAGPLVVLHGREQGPRRDAEQGDDSACDPPLSSAQRGVIGERVEQRLHRRPALLS
jgi:hypothetical protein